MRGTAGAAADPDWLLADRLVGLRAFGTLPIETNPLYTTYVDLRNARLADVRPCTGPAAVVTGAARTKLLPDGAAAYAESALVLSAEARAAGVILETLADLQARDPGLFRQLLDGGCALPENDKLAQMTRALWSQGLLLHVPNGVRLERPVVLRWKVGAPGKALFSRTVISLGEDAEVSVVEEQVASGSAERSDASEAQAFFAGTTEAVVGAGSSDRSPSSIARRCSGEEPRFAGRWPSWAAASSAVASTTGSTATVRRSSRRRSSSVPPTSSST